MKTKKTKGWIIINRKGDAYIGWWLTASGAREGHISDLGYLKWKQAYDKGDRCVKATITYKL